MFRDVERATRASVPKSVDAEKIRASYDYGVLTVTLPKAEKAKPRQTQVELLKS